MTRHLVRDWMSSPVVTVHEQTLLPEARSLLAQHAVRRLPVVDDAGRLVGIITQNDIFRISASAATDVQDYDLYCTNGRLPVRRFMTRTPVTAAPDETIVDVARRMLAHKISGLPIIEDNSLIGIITESNIFRVMIAEDT
jgi:CBS domain-containing protein